MYQVVQGVPWHVISRYKEYRVRYVRALHRGVAESVDATDLISYEFKSRHPYHYFLDVAQFGRALGLGPRGQRFKSFYPDHICCAVERVRHP